MDLKGVMAGLALLAFFAWFWRGRGIRELALVHAQKRCHAEGLQLLDAHVAFAGWKWWTTAEGRRYWLRCYVFEFSATGQDRHTALIRMHGRRLVQLELPPYPVAREEQVPPVADS